MNTRPFINSDIEECAKICIQAYNQPPWNYNWNYDKAVKYLNEYIEGSRFVGFVLCKDDNIVGAMLGHSKTWWTNDVFFVDELFVSPENQKMGYGKLLLAQTEKYAREQGCEVITLMTNKYMPAMEFYNSFNYTHAEHFVFVFKPLQF